MPECGVCAGSWPAASGDPFWMIGNDVVNKAPKDEGARGALLLRHSQCNRLFFNENMDSFLRLNYIIRNTQLLRILRLYDARTQIFIYTSACAWGDGAHTRVIFPPQTPRRTAGVRCARNEHDVGSANGILK